MHEVVLFSPLREHDAFLYLEVPNEVIDAFLKMIPERGLGKPSLANHPTEYVGAHISVIYPEEMKRVKKRVKEIGDDFQYTLGKLYRTRPDKWGDVEEVYFITVNSPQLEGLRRKYGLRPKLNDHDFHLTVAIRLRK